MAKINLTTQGCSNNLRESELMMGLLSNSGFGIAQNKDEADVNVINICTVKGDTTALREIRKTKQKYPDKKIVVAGCITESIMPKIKELDDNINFINTHNFGSISSVVNEALNNNHIELINKKYEPKVNLPSVRKNPVIGIVPILNSCNYFCTFCSTKLVKGKLMSYSMDDIRQDVKNHLKAGCREIWITSQDTGAYMIEQGGKPKLIELLNQILSVPMDFRLRLGMMNPGNTIKILDGLIEIYKNEKMFKFLHVPVQSGSNEILKKMNRQYKVEEFFEFVDKFRKEIPEITVSTDIIVGFPEETNEQFNDSIDLLKKIKPDVLNFSGFALREGTVAAKMKQMNGAIIKERTKKMSALFRKTALEKNKKWIGWKGKILIDEIGKNSTWIGRNYCYKPVIVKGDFKLGDEIEVEIYDAASFDLRGKSSFNSYNAKSI